MIKSFNNTAFILVLVLFAIAVAGCDKSKESSEQAQSKTPEGQMDAMQTEQGGNAMSAESSMSPAMISFTKAALYPESLDYDAANNRFLVTSLREGIVGEVKDDGSYAPLLQDENMVSAVGIRIDAAHDRVLVCNSDPGASMHTKPENQGKLAGLAIFQLSTAKLITYLDLGKLSEGGHFCNDIALDTEGNAYVTDSFSPNIYKIDMQNNATILLSDDRFKGEGFNLNGIVVLGDSLIVAKYNEGLLFKVPLNDPKKFTQITIAQTMPGADGLVLTADGHLLVIANMETNKIFKLATTDNWASAAIANSVDTGAVFATTGVLRGGELYALDAMLHVLFNPETKEHVEKFQIRKHVL